MICPCIPHDIFIDQLYIVVNDPKFNILHILPKFKTFTPHNLLKNALVSCNNAYIHQ